MSAKPNQNFPKVGEKVSWVVTRNSGSSIRVSERVGTVMEVNESGVCTVKMRNGRKQVLMAGNLCREGEPSAGTHAFNSLVGALLGRSYDEKGAL